MFRMLSSAKFQNLQCRYLILLRIFTSAKFQHLPSCCLTLFSISSSAKFQHLPSCCLTLFSISSSAKFQHFSTLQFDSVQYIFFSKVSAFLNAVVWLCSVYFLQQSFSISQRCWLVLFCVISSIYCTLTKFQHLKSYRSELYCISIYWKIVLLWNVCSL